MTDVIWIIIIMFASSYHHHYEHHYHHYNHHHRHHIRHHVCSIIIVMLATDACTALGQGEAASSSIAAEESCQHVDLQLERADFSDLTSHAMENDIVLRPEVSGDDDVSLA